MDMVDFFTHIIQYLLEMDNTELESINIHSPICIQDFRSTFFYNPILWQCQLNTLKGTM